MKKIKKYLKIYIYLQEKVKKFNYDKISYDSIIMEYKKIINWLQGAPNQPSKFRTKTWVELNDESPGTCNFHSQIKFNNLMLRSSLCDYNDAYIYLRVQT